MTAAVPLKILMVEDSPTDAELLLYELRRTGYPFEYQRVDTEDRYLNALVPGLDLILADFSLPRFDARRALALLQQSGLDIPFIVITGTVSEEVAVEIMRLGAADYLLKDRLARLGPAIDHALQQKRLRDQKRQDDEAIRRYTYELEALVDERTEKLREALQHERELNDLKSRIASMVSHEFRTPLAVIQSASDLLMHYHDRMTEERRREQLGEIHHQVLHLTEMLEDILLLNRAQAVGPEISPQSFDLETLIREVAHDLQQTQSTRTILISVRCNRGPALLDPKLTRQVIGNLLGNAVKYSRQDGRIWVDMAGEAHRAVLTVRDEGIGIPEGDLPHLFQMFHRAGNVGTISGTGLGLAIVKQAIEAHHGTIEVESTVGVGTTFTVTLPYVDVKQTNDSIREHRWTPPPDSPSNLELLREDRDR